MLVYKDMTLAAFFWVHPVHAYFKVDPVVKTIFKDIAPRLSG